MLRIEAGSSVKNKEHGHADQDCDAEANDSEEQFGHRHRVVCQPPMPNIRRRVPFLNRRLTLGLTQI